MTAALVDRVRRRLVAERIDLGDAIRLEAGGIVDDAVFARLRADVGAQLLGLGPLEALFTLPGLTDVLVNGPRSVWIDRGHGLEPAGGGVPRFECRTCPGAATRDHGGSPSGRCRALR